MKFVSVSGREFNTYAEAQWDEYEYYNESHMNINDVIENIIFYDRDGNIIPIDINDFKDSFENAHNESKFVKIGVDINEDTIPNINRFYDSCLSLPFKPGVYRYDADYDNWRNFSDDKNALKEWEVLMVKASV